MVTGLRLTIVTWSIFLAVTVIALRLGQLQYSKGEMLAERALRQRYSVETITPRPGDIVDRNGRLLAVSVRRPSLFVVPSRIDDVDAYVKQIASALPIDSNRLAERLRENSTKQFLWVQRRLAEDQALAVQKLTLPAETWGFREEFARCYPQGPLAAHILGIRDIDNNGRGGTEEKYQSLLQGKAGRRVIIRDAHGRPIDVPADLEVPPEPGRTIVLSIDSAIQIFAEQALDQLVTEYSPNGACAIVVHVPSGELLAVSSRPTFDPNHPSKAPSDGWVNRAISDIYEPGSTFKPLVVAWALEQSLISTGEEFDCEGGVYRSGGRVLHDHHGYSTLSLTDVLVKSSNIGMAKIGERLGRDGLHQCALSFGFGSSTGLGLPGEQQGTLRPLDQWTDYSIGSIPMGHELAVTPLQLITAHVALANGGKLVSPRLVLRDVDPVLKDRGPPVVPHQPSGLSSPILKPEVAAWVVGEAMADVVQRGTGKAAKLENFRVFGKTGTAQKYDAELRSFSHSRYVVSFIAGAPAEDPQVLVLVMADEPTGPNPSGGKVAAPAAADILKRTLHYRGVKPQHQ